MVGPSSSHTAGAARLGLMARAIIGETPRTAEIFLHGSFAETGRGHGTDKAIVAGLLGFETFDDRLKDAFEHATAAGMTFEIKAANLGARMHPCSVKIAIVDGAGERLEVIGSSLGGGSVVLTNINGYEVKLSGSYHTLITIHEDRPGLIREATAVLADHGVNIAFMQVARKRRGEDAFMTLETDQPIPGPCVQAIRALPGMVAVRILPLLN